MEKFKYLEHTADIKFQAFGKTKEDAFKNSAFAMFNSMNSEPIKEKIKKKISVQGKDYENLLYEFLEELLFLFDTELFFLSKIKNLKISKDNKLAADITGDSAENYEMKTDIKAVTYNEMFVKKQKGNWVCQVVLDI
jgi:SHS2 domain-containing protein